MGLHQGTWAHTGLQLAKYQKYTGEVALAMPASQSTGKVKAKKTVPGKRKEKLNLSKNIVPEHWQGQGQIGLPVV